MTSENVFIGAFIILFGGIAITFFNILIRASIDAFQDKDYSQFFLLTAFIVLFTTISISGILMKLGI